MEKKVCSDAIPNNRLCENFFRALRAFDFAQARLSSGRTDKYSISNDTIPFVVSIVEP
jgi:hypothetical protein